MAANYNLPTKPPKLIRAKYVRKLTSRNLRKTNKNRKTT